MNEYRLPHTTIDSVELKALVVSRGLKVDNAVYRHFSETHRLNVNPLHCNCFLLSDGTVVQLTDMGFHLQYLSGLLSWSNLKLLRYASQLTTPFTLRLSNEKPALFYNNTYVDMVSFPPRSDFYKQKTASGCRFVGNTVLQGLDWVAFPCLWPCAYAASGKPCQFCFSGGDFETRAKQHKPLPKALDAATVAEMIRYAFEHVGATHIQISGGATFDGAEEATHIRAYLTAMAADSVIARKCRERLLYITPPADKALIDEYFSLGADRLACSLEVWDENFAREITPGKMAFTTRARHMDMLTYTAEKQGPGKAFSNFIIGVEPFKSLRDGATALAQRGILPTASVWMPMGRPVRGSMVPPDADYYRRVKECFADLYTRYQLSPPHTRGLNVCIERDIMRFAEGT